MSAGAGKGSAKFRSPATTPSSVLLAGTRRSSSGSAVRLRVCWAPLGAGCRPGRPQLPLRLAAAELYSPLPAPAPTPALSPSLPRASALLASKCRFLLLGFSRRPFYLFARSRVGSVQLSRYPPPSPAAPSTSLPAPSRVLRPPPLPRTPQLSLSLVSPINPTPLSRSALQSPGSL